MNISASTISFNNYDPRTLAFLIRHQQVHRGLPLQIQLAYARTLITAPTVGLLKAYAKNYEVDEPKYFVLYFAAERKDVNITADLTSENYCPLIEGAGKKLLSPSDLCFSSI